MIENWLVAEILAEQRASEQRKASEQARCWGRLEPERHRPGLRHRLARALVGVGRRLDAEAIHSALADSSSHS